MQCIKKAGVIVVNNGMAILFGTRDGCFTEGGGAVEIDDISLKHTAVRELREESCNLFNFSPEDLDDNYAYVSCKYKMKFYYVGLEGVIDTDYFYRNRRFYIKHAPMSWKEKNRVQMFYLSNISDVNLTNIYGETGFFIPGRTKEAFQNIKINYRKCITSCKFNDEFSFLNGTVFYRILKPIILIIHVPSPRIINVPSSRIVDILQLSDNTFCMRQIDNFIIILQLVMYCVLIFYVFT